VYLFPEQKLTPEILPGMAVTSPKLEIMRRLDEFRFFAFRCWHRKLTPSAVFWCNMVPFLCDPPKRVEIQRSSEETAKNWETDGRLS
jgi:hypothetical protein